MSREDFFSPPSLYTATDVNFTGWIAMGGASKTVTMSIVNKIALIIFDGTTGQQVRALMSNSTIPRYWSTR